MYFERDVETMGEGITHSFSVQFKILSFGQFHGSIKYYRSNITSFKILNDVVMYILLDPRNKF